MLATPTPGLTPISVPSFSGSLAVDLQFWVPQVAQFNSVQPSEIRTMKKHLLPCVVAALCGAAFIAAPARAQVPNLINYQGRVGDAQVGQWSQNASITVG